MQRLAIRSVFLSFIILLLSTTVVYAGEWESLGKWNIKSTKKSANILVKSETPYRVLKLNVGIKEIYIRSVTIYFTDDTKYVAEINSAIGPNSDTPPIRPPEKGPAIKKVRFNYKAKKRTLVTVWASTDASLADEFFLEEKEPKK